MLADVTSGINSLSSPQPSPRSLLRSISMMIMVPGESRELQQSKACFPETRRVIWGLIELTHVNPSPVHSWPRESTPMQTTSVERRLLAATIVLLGFLQAQTATAQKVLVLPYVQPGDGRTLDGSDVKVIHWWTDQTMGEVPFVVEYQLPWDKVQTVRPIRLALDFAAPKPIPK